MVKLPRIKIAPPERWPALLLPSSVKGRIIAGFGLLVIILVAIVAASAWLSREHRSHLAEMDQHAATASLFRKVEVEALGSTALLQFYVISGNESVVPLIRFSGSTAIGSLREARSNMQAQRRDADVARMDELIATAGLLSEGGEQVIALRQSGDVEGAAAALDEGLLGFQQLAGEFNELAEQESQEVATLRIRADTTADLAFWLLVITGAAGAGLGLGVSIFMARSILKPLSSLEATALAVTSGDLEARAPATGPRELARLGASLNQMTGSLLELNRSLEHKVGERTEELQDRTTQLQAISEAMTTYLESGNWNEASAMLLRSALSQTESEYGFVGVIMEGPALRILAHEGIVWDALLNREFYENALRTYQEVGYLEFTNFGNLFGKVITEGKTLLTNEPAADPRSGGLPPGHPPLRHFLGVPIFKGAAVVGMIGVANRPGGYGGAEQGRIEILTQAAGVLYENYRQRQREAALEAEGKLADDALRRLNQELEKEHREIEKLNRSLEKKVSERTRELRRANEELQQRNCQLLDARAQAATDALTGLSNHRAFHERIRDEVSQARENGNELGLIMMDIDVFKRVNDSLGHLAGDQVLRELASVLAKAAGRDDVYRYGGDEFAVVLPTFDRRKAGRVAERLRRAVEKRTDGNGDKVTVSLGVTSFPETAASAEELIYEADAAMYWAKSAGKNRVGDWSELVGDGESGRMPWYATDRAVRAPDVVAALVAALAAKDPATCAHTERCSWYAGRLSEELGLAEGETSVVRLASLLHDIGKLAVPDEVLFKPGPLNDEEWAQIKQHPTAALHVLGQIHSIADATPAILHHHEHFDGSGYPDGLSRGDIPIASRILLVTDAFDAMTTDRPYRKAMPVEAAVKELKRNSGSQFDPEVVEAFLRILARDGAQPLQGTAPVQAAPTPEPSAERQRRR